MATALATTIAATMSSTYSLTSDQGSGSIIETITGGTSLTNGTGSGQADELWYDERTLAGTSESLDLAGSLVNSYNETVTFVTVKAIIIKNTATTTGYTLTIGGAGGNDFDTWVGDASDKVVIGPGGVFVLTSPIDGYDVTAGTGDILKVDSGANTVTYEIGIVGTSA